LKESFYVEHKDGSVVSSSYGFSFFKGKEGRKLLHLIIQSS